MGSDSVCDGKRMRYKSLESGLAKEDLNFGARIERVWDYSIH